MKKVLIARSENLPNRKPTIPALTGAFGHDHLPRLNADDLTTWKCEVAALSGVAFSGIQ
ncbi:hypothetical protein [uncultured Tateyamaria sp.]|uniref:hypothetical protein n=1 Tax=uncultured Tateyamaria sp. TaxID=455651 RepID=UPI0026089ECF|nr:hypothetical protein [uncultured Tateyamaria sp.]